MMIKQMECVTYMIAIFNLPIPLFHLPMVQTWHTEGARSACADLRCEIQFSFAGITVAQNGQRKLAAGRITAELPAGGAAVTGMSLVTATGLLGGAVEVGGC